MSKWTWAQIETLTRQLAQILVRQVEPSPPVALPESCERAIDDWVRAYARSPRPEFVFPTDPLQRLGLLARLTAASAFAMQARTSGLPPHPTSAPATALEVMLIDYWHDGARERWLAGSHRHDFSEN